MRALTGRVLPALRRRRVWIPCVVVGALLLSYAGAYVYVGGGVPRGTSVRGVDIGGMSVASAEQKLTRELGDAATDPLPVRVDDKTYEIDPKDAGLVFDAEATAEAAEGRSASPVRLARQIAGRAEVDPVVRVDGAKLAAALDGVAKKFDREVREGKVTYEGTEPVATLPRNGRVLHHRASAATLRKAFPTDRTLDLRAKTVRPKSTEDAVREVVEGAARTAVASPVTLGTGKKELSVSTKAIAANTEFVTGASGELAPKVDGKGLAADVGDKLDELEKAPKDATFAIKKGKPKVVPAVAGRMVDRTRLGQAVADVLGKTDDREVSAPVSEAEPKMTTKKAESLGIKQKVSTFTTNHPCCQPRVTNIHQAAQILDGTLVKPGKTFSLNGTLGERTREKGFVPAPMILNGRHVDSVGGGVSQIATTTFNAMFFAGLEDVQHKPHSYYISRYPLGREATVSWTQPDLRFKNDAKTGILITTTYSDTSITVTMWGTKRYDIDATSPKKSNYRNPKTIRDKSKDCTPESPAVGYDVTYSRIFKQGGEVVRTEPFRTVYLATPNVICVKDEKKKDGDSTEKPADRTEGG